MLLQFQRSKTIMLEQLTKHSSQYFISIYPHLSLSHTYARVAALHPYYTVLQFHQYEENAHIQPNNFHRASRHLIFKPRNREYHLSISSSKREWRLWAVKAISKGWNMRLILSRIYGTGNSLSWSASAHTIHTCTHVWTGVYPRLIPSARERSTLRNEVCDNFIVIRWARPRGEEWCTRCSMWRAVCCVAGLCGRFSSVSVSEKGAPGHWPARRRSLWSWVAMVTNGPPIPKMRRGKPPKRNGRPSIARLTLEPITPLYAYIACYARKTKARYISLMHVIVSCNPRLYNEKCVVLVVVRRRLR